MSNVYPLFYYWLLLEDGIASIYQLTTLPALIVVMAVVNKS